MMEASAKTTVARKVEKAPWKTWGPVLVKNGKFRIEDDSGASEITEQYLARDEVTLADLLVPS